MLNIAQIIGGSCFESLLELSLHCQQPRIVPIRRQILVAPSVSFVKRALFKLIPHIGQSAKISAYLLCNARHFLIPGMPVRDIRGPPEQFQKPFGTRDCFGLFIEAPKCVKALRALLLAICLVDRLRQPVLYPY